MNNCANAIISIRPVFAAKILSGEKTVELRRRIPQLDKNTRLWIYATRPTAAVIGSVVLTKTITMTPEKLWEDCGKKAAVTRKEYDAYFVNSTRAIGMFLTEIHRVLEVDIEQLRKVRNCFHPPQTITKLTREESDILISYVRPCAAKP